MTYVLLVFLVVGLLLIYKGTRPLTDKDRGLVSYMITHLEYYEPLPEGISIRAMDRPKEAKSSTAAYYSVSTKEVVIYNTRNIKEVVDSYFHEGEHARQHLQEPQKLYMSINAMDEGNWKSYYNSWHEVEARKASDLKSPLFKKYYNKKSKETV